MRIFQHGLLLSLDSDPGLPGSTETDFSATSTEGAETTTAAPETGAGATSTEKPSDDTARPTNAPKAGIAKRIRARISGVFAKAGFSKGKGRPKKCRSCGGEKCSECGFTGFEPGKGDTPGDGDPNAATEEIDGAGSDEKPAGDQNTPGPYSDGREIIDAALESGTAVALDALDTVILFSADITGHDPDFSERAVAGCRTKADKNIERFSQALKLWFKEDNIVIEKPGKKTAILCGAQMLLPYTNLLRHFRSEAARRARLNLKK